MRGWWLLILFVACDAIADCNSELLTPTKVVVKEKKFFVNGAEFFVKGVGYSPIPPGLRTLQQSFDYFTSEHRHMWERDLPLMKAMGANVVRLWSWDSTVDHTEFLDFVYQHGLYVMVPFDMKQADYKDLTMPDTFRQALVDWKAFVLRIKDHPAVFCYLVGNELNSDFVTQIDALFGLVNTMVEVRATVDAAMHPVTIPLSDDDFINYVSKYYPYLNIDFWSLQVYRDRPSLHTSLFQQYDQCLKNNSESAAKPLVLTEFGVDSLAQSATGTVENQTEQAQALCEYWCIVDNEPSAAGGVIMEWVDEWWKGGFADVRNKLCPNQRTDMHTNCSKDLAPKGAKPVILHEEWLGIFMQGDLSMQGALSEKYCIRPRVAYCTMQREWRLPRGNQTNNIVTYCQQHCAAASYPSCSAWAPNGIYVERENEWTCAYRRSVWLLPSVLFVPIFLLFILVLSLAMYLNPGWWRREKRVGMKPVPSEPALDSPDCIGNASTNLESDEEGTEDSSLLPRKGVMRMLPPKVPAYEPSTSENGRYLEEQIREAFARFTFGEKSFFPVPQSRIFHLIWDKYSSCGSTTREGLELAVRMVYEQMFEEYYLWRGCDSMPRERPDGSAFCTANRLRDLALMSIIQQWAGTINHSPEKICEVFDFSLDYLQDVLPDKGIEENARQTLLQWFHYALVEIFRVYYLKIDEGYNFEDINLDALKHRFDVSSKYAAKRDQMKQISDWEEGPFYDEVMKEHAQKNPDFLPEYCLLPVTAARTAKNLPPELRYHLYPNPEQRVEARMARCFFFSRNFQRGFPHKGGVMTLLFNYTWILRLGLWLWMTAWYAQPNYYLSKLCFGTALQYLTFGDCILKWLATVLHRRVLGHWSMWLLAELVFYSLWLWVLGSTYLVSEFSLIRGQSALSFFWDYLSSANPDGKFANIAKPLGINANSIYLAINGILVLGNEIKLYGRGTQPYEMPGRFQTRQARVKYVRWSFGVCLALVVSLGIAVGPYVVQQTPLLKFWPDMWLYLWVLATSVVGMFACWAVARFVGKITVGKNAPVEVVREVQEEALYLLQNAYFWGLFLLGNWFIQYSLVIPAIIKIRPQQCVCHESDPILDSKEEFHCETRVMIVCVLAVLFTWLSAILVCFAFTYAVFEFLLLAIGIVRGKVLRVGNVQSWNQVERHWVQIRRKCLPRVSEVFLQKQNQDKFWNLFVDSLFQEHLLSKGERDRLWADENKPPNFAFHPRNAEAMRRIIVSLWSLEALIAHEERNPGKPATRAHRVRSMPSWTVIVPAYNETIIFSEDQLKKTRSGKKNRITEIEFLVNTYPDEWENFCEMWRPQDNEWVADEDRYAAELLEAFVGLSSKVTLKAETILAIRLWASYRGQTLSRTLRGLMNARQGLVELARLEESMTEEEIQDMVSKKYQIIIAHQTFNATANIETDMDTQNEEDMHILFKQFRFFDLVFNNDGNFTSVLRRLRPEALAKPEEPIKFQKILVVNKDGTKARKKRLYDRFEDHEFEELVIQRVGRLKLGEGKAENQLHALQFARGTVLQANDMNQYFTLENALKLPFVLREFFGTPDNLSEENWAEMEHQITCRTRLLGFPEWTYSRSLSMIGELMGSAEFCFVTIFHRVLNWPLRMRLHYGHPDFFCGFWARTRGGTSKASPLVNTNEDIFAGYEMLGRGELVDYIEFLEGQKGRESSFREAFTFEAKLAQGAAQQCRSLDVYKLNQRLDCIQRFGLFYSSLAFYVTNLIMAISINYYILSIAMFALSDITYHQLGLLGAVIAVPWLFQIGYVMAFPMVAELVVEKGFWRGMGAFLWTLPASLVFFVFHLRTKTYFFAQGLLLGKGGYSGTGRGFGLDRLSLVDMYKVYAESHFHEAMLLLLCLVAYGAFSGDPFLPYLVRCVTIILIVFSWLFAPHIFNPMPTSEDLQNDSQQFRWWLAQEFRVTEKGTMCDFEDELNEQHSQRVTGMEPPNAKSPKDTIINRFWGNVKSSNAPENHSWCGWWWKDVLIRSWESEDLFFPDILPLVFQRAYLMTELFLPWLFISYKFWHSDSLYYVALLALCWAYFRFVDFALHHSHEYSLLIKFLVVIVLPPAYLFLRHSPMTVGEFLWSMAFYILLFFISLELLMGTWNLACKKGWDVTKRISCFRNKADIEEGREREPFQIPKDFGKEMESAEPPPTVDAMTPSPPSPSCKLTEEQRAKLIAIYSQEWHELRLFTLRIQIPRVVASLRKLLALLSFILLVLCNAATVMFSGILTTMMFNSRVAECWKKAYLRSDKVDAEELDEPAPSAREPSGRDYRSQRRSTSRSNRLLPASMSRGIGALSSDPINVQPRGTQALTGAFSVPVRAPALSPGSPSSSSAQAAAKPLPPPPARQVPILGAMPPKVAPRMQPVQPRTTSLGTPSVPPPSGQGT